MSFLGFLKFQNGSDFKRNDQHSVALLNIVSETLCAENIKQQVTSRNLNRTDGLKKKKKKEHHSLVRLKRLEHLADREQAEYLSLPVTVTGRALNRCSHLTQSPVCWERWSSQQHAGECQQSNVLT